MKNIALFKPTSNSYKGGIGLHAVDGDFTTTVTIKGEQLWSVDLQKETIVTHLTIYKNGKTVVSYVRIISYVCVQKFLNVHI